MSGTCHVDAHEQSLWARLWSDHRRMDAILEDVRELAALGSFATAGRRFGEFRIAQEKHLLAEEEVLDLLGTTPDPPVFIDRVRQEHREVLALMDEISGHLSRWEVELLPPSLDQLANVLAAHESVEQRLLFPELERTLHDKEAYQRLLQKVARP